MKHQESFQAMRVIVYDKSFKVLRSYDTFTITVPCSSNKGKYTRFTCDALAIDKPIVGKTYHEKDREHILSTFIANEYRSCSFGGCMLIIPSFRYVVLGIDKLIDIEKQWHKQEGWMIDNA